MIRIPLLVFALYISIVSSFAQSDTSRYEPRKLKIEEVNFVSSYYHQDGNNAAVTGGIGSEKLTDFASTIDIKLSKADSRNRVNSFVFEIGVDTYSSASSDQIDPLTVSSASYSDQRIYPSITWSRLNEQRGSTLGAGFSVSSEYDYLSLGGEINGFKESRNKSRQVGLRLQTYQDFVTMIYPIEQRSGKTGGVEPRKTYSATASYSQIINRRLHILFLLDFAWQQGFLSTSFNRVYFNDNSLGIENLPDARTKFPMSIRMNYFLGDRIILRSFYRYYQDDWGLKAHTGELETSIKITPFVSISPFYRYYVQSAVHYFKGYQQHQMDEQFYTSDYDLSKFNSHFAGAGFRVVSPDGIFGIRKFNALEIRYGHYSRQTGLISNIISLNAKFR